MNKRAPIRIAGIILPPVFTGLLVLMSVLLALSVWYYHNTIYLPPSHIHSWTQSDRFAIALCYLENGFNLFLPQTYNLATQQGITASDLPLAEYAVAIIMKITGSTQPAIFRAFVLLLNFIGYGYLFALVYRLTGSTLKGIIAAVFVFTIPVIGYYQAGFIPSSVALPLLLAGYYHLFKYKQSGEAKQFYIALLFAAIAALVRLPFVVFLVAIILQQLINWIRAKHINRKELLAICMAVVAILTYNLYKKYVEVHYGSAFLNFLMPASSFKEAMGLAAEIFKRWKMQFLTSYHLVVLVILLLASIIGLLRNKQHPPLLPSLLLQAAIVFAGACIYFLLMQQQFVDHEYYFIDTFYPFIVLLLVAGLMGADVETPALNAIYLGVVVAALGFAANSSYGIQTEKYSYHKWDEGEITRESFTGADKFLDSLGVPAKAKLLVLNAFSTNGPLIQMKRQGYTLIKPSQQDMPKLFQQNFDYVVAQDIYLAPDAWYYYNDMQYRLARLGGNGKISVYRLAAFDSSGTLPKLLGTVEQPEIWNGTSIGNQWDNNGVVYDSSTHSFFMPAANEFGPGYSYILTDTQPANWLMETTLLTSDVESGNAVNLALHITQNDSTLLFSDCNFKFRKNKNEQKLAVLFKLPQHYPAGAQLKCFIWNYNKASFGVKEIRVTKYN